MELNHLRCFYEVARLKSFTQASKVLRVSQPSISRTVKLLEAREEVRLLDRNRRSVRLTPTGELYFQRCERVFNELANLKREVETRRSGCRGTLLIGASDNVCNYLLPSLIETFREQFPRVSFQIYSGTSRDIKREMSEGKLELAIFFTVPKEGSFHLTKLAFVPFAVVCAGRSRRFSGVRADRQALQREPLIGCGSKEYRKSYPVGKMLRSLQVEDPVSQIEANSQETMKRFALRDMGYTIVPEFMVRDEVATERLRILKTSIPIGSDVYLVCQRDQTLSTVAALFKKHLQVRLAPMLS